MHSDGTVERKTATEPSFDDEDEMVVDDGFEIMEEASDNEFSSEFPSNLKEDSSDEGMPLHLYVYGVRLLALHC